MVSDRIQLPSGLELASIGQRAIAALIDAVVAAGIWYPFFHFWGKYNEQTSQYEVTGFPALSLFAATAAYWIFTEWLFGGTIGKLLLGLRVVSVDGRKCSFTQSLKRNLLRIIDFIVFYLIAFITAKLTPLRQRLGDQWARTIVVQQKRELLSTSPSERRVSPS